MTKPTTQLARRAYDPSILDEPWQPEMKDLLLARISLLQRQTLGTLVEVGRCCQKLKDHLPRGEFLPALESIGVSERSAQRAMHLARRLPSGDFRRLLALPPGKAAALMEDLTPEDLAAFEANERVGGLGGRTADEITDMTRAELAEELGRARAKIERGKGQLQERDDRIEQLAAQVQARAKDGGADLAHPFLIAAARVSIALADAVREADELSDKELLNEACGGDQQVYRRVLAGMRATFDMAMERLNGRCGLAGYKKTPVGKWFNKPNPDLDL